MTVIMTYSSIPFIDLMFCSLFQFHKQGGVDFLTRLNLSTGESPMQMKHLPSIENESVNVEEKQSGSERRQGPESGDSKPIQTTDSTTIPLSQQTLNVLNPWTIQPPQASSQQTKGSIDHWTASQVTKSEGRPIQIRPESRRPVAKPDFRPLVIESSTRSSVADGPVQQRGSSARVRVSSKPGDSKSEVISPQSMNSIETKSST